jgi:hypothetical protein
MDIEPTNDVTAPVMNRKTRYYYAHKAEPQFQNRLREAKRKYYEANKGRLIQKALERYYRNKQNPTVADETMTTAIGQ